MASERGTKAKTRMVVAALIVAVVFVGISIPMMRLVGRRGELREIPWIKVTGPIQETITFENGDVTLAGTLDLPAGEGPFPALVTIHGSPPLTRNDRYNLYMSDFFLQHGFAVLRYDKRGVGESTGTYVNPGDWNLVGGVSRFAEVSTAKFNDLANDAIAGVEYLKTLDYIDPDMIGVIGFSQGGWIAPHAASKSDSVAFSVALSGTTATIGQEMYYSDLVEHGETDISLEEASNMARDVFKGAHGYDPLLLLEAINVPCLWILGGQDRSIPVPLTIEIIDSLVADQGKDFSYVYYPNMHHGWKDVDTAGLYPVLNDALEWLEEKFPGRIH